ncbi:hypothetical protein [Ruthenibacterium lactatiformans]
MQWLAALGGMLLCEPERLKKIQLEFRQRTTKENEGVAEDEKL